jgi:hypothetical protein
MVDTLGLALSRTLIIDDHDPNVVAAPGVGLQAALFKRIEPAASRRCARCLASMVSGCRRPCGVE